MSKAKTKSKAWKHPKLGMIPAGWEVLRFADAFEFLPTNSFSRDQMTYNGSKDSVFNIHYGDIHATFTEQLLDFKKHLSQVPVLANNGVSPDENELLQDGDLIIADASEDYDGVGECIELAGIGKRKVVAGLHTLAAREKLGKISPGFRAYLLKHPRVFIELKKLATGSKVYGISKTNVSNLEVVVPPRDENHEIAHILSTWDKAIERTEQLIAQKQQLKKGLMQQLLTGKVRFKEFVKSKKMKQTKLGLVPEDWEVKTLGDIGRIRMCKRVFNNETSDIGDIPFYKIGTFGKSPDAFISKELYESYRKRYSFPKKGEILISASGTLGRTVVYDGSPAYFQDSNIVWIDNDESVALNSFLLYVLEIIKYESEGGTIQRLYNDIISNAKFLRPGLPEQRKIAAALASSEDEIITLQRRLLKLNEEKKGLMQKLLTGEVRVKV